MSRITVAVSESTFKTAFGLLQRNFAMRLEETVTLGAVRAGIDARARLENGDVSLRQDGTVKVGELDLRWSRLTLSLEIDLPSICVGGGCIGTRWLRICLPRYCVFTAATDVSVAVDLAPYVGQEVSFESAFAVRYWDPAAPGPDGPDPCEPVRDLLVAGELLDAFPTDRKQWHVHLAPGPVDVDLFDFPDVAGDLVEGALRNAVVGLLPEGPARTLVLAVIGSATDLIRTVLDAPDDFEEWLSDLFNVSFGLLDVVIQVVAAYFGRCIPLFRIDDPFVVMEAEGDLLPVSIPIDDVKITADDDELVITADIGAGT
ncbi:MAG: hypothetical protein JNL94_11260 [Planctomycetes bacterium]|nr:hypothetical protein [Planctomycetota bacterium]